MEGIVIAVCRSEKKGTVKVEIPVGILKEGFGLEGDAHGGNWHRQISLLAEESIDKMRNKGLELKFGDFAENITTKGLILHKLPVGTLLKIGEEVIMEVTQIGKKCHHDCEIFKKIGSCIMPLEGIFACIIRGGSIKAGDKIVVEAID
ncbi:MAG: MOSC domain-containing protein [Halanaerobiales bacterium]|nr:MOSC domain-containing protein [Halanaerobiales bacterium]